MMSIKQTMTDYICSVVRPKLAFFEHIPHKVCGAFAGALGSYGEETARRCVKECFEEWDGIGDKGSAHPVSFTLFQGTVVAVQLRAYWERDQPLANYREAFTLVQEYALGACVGRIVEAEMSTIQHSMTTGKSVSLPALGCARQRRRQVIDVTRTTEGMDWLVAHWHSRGLWADVLSHVAPAAEINAMPFSEKCARVYHYSEKDTFEEHAETASDIDSFNKLLGKTQALPPIPANAAASLCVRYFKGRLNTTGIYSVHRDVWAAGVSGAQAAFRQLAGDDIIASIQDPN